MASQQQQKRLRNEYDEAVQALQDEDDQKIDSSIKAILLATKNNAEDLTEWSVVFEGKEYTPLQGGNYKLRVRVGEQYPYEPPQVWILDGFQHFHVFAGGKVCFKLLNKDNWKLGYTIIMLLNGIIKMLHSDPEVSDPASTTLTRLIQPVQSRYHQPNLKQYNKFLREQAKRFSNRYEMDINRFREDHGLLPQNNPQNNLVQGQNFK